LSGCILQVRDLLDFRSLGYEPSILPRAQGPVRVSAAWEQVLASFVLRHAKIVVEGLSRSTPTTGRNHIV